MTGLLKSTKSSLICPEICEPTATVVTADSVPEAETTAVSAPRSTLASRNPGALSGRERAATTPRADHGDERERAAGDERAGAAGGTSAALRGHRGGSRSAIGDALHRFMSCVGPRGARARAASAVLRQRLLLGKLAAQRAQARLDDRRLVEVAVAGLRRQLELDHRAAQVALPGVVLALVPVLLLLLAQRPRTSARRAGAAARCRGSAASSLLEKGGGIACASGLEQRLRIVVDRAASCSDSARAPPRSARWRGRGRRTPSARDPPSRRSSDAAGRSSRASRARPSPACSPRRAAATRRDRSARRPRC